MLVKREYLRIYLYLQDITSPKPQRGNLGADSRYPSVKRRIEDLEQLPAPKSFKRHRSFDVSKENVSDCSCFISYPFSASYPEFILFAALLVENCPLSFETYAF